jgi:hypothetical protein
LYLIRVIPAKEAASQVLERDPRKGRNPMTKQEKTGQAGDQSRRGLGLFAAIALLSILGIIVWLVINGNDDTS